MDSALITMFLDSNMTREEAIKIIKEFISGTCLHLVDQEALKTLIPELRENDDERIKEDLIGGLMWQRDNLETIGPHDNNNILPGFCFPVSEHLAYLEKQKEQKHYWKPTETDVALFNKAVITNKTLTPTERAQLDIIRSKFGCCRATTCNGIVQNPIKCIDFNNEFENQISHLLASVLNGEYEYNKDFIKYASQSLLEYAKKEQKHTEWSKEDSLYLTNAILSAEKEWGNESCTAKWLKSLPERLNLQSKQEWSDNIIRKAVKEVGLTQHQINWFETNVFPPKQEWTEEDKRMLSRCIKSVECSKQFADSGTYKAAKDAEMIWLQNLSERFNLPPKQEWSEEDEKIRKALIWHLKADVDFVSNGVTKTECLAYLNKQKAQKQEWSVKGNAHNISMFLRSTFM